MKTTNVYKKLRFCINETRTFVILEEETNTQIHQNYTKVAKIFFAIPETTFNIPFGIHKSYFYNQFSIFADRNSIPSGFGNFLPCGLRFVSFLIFCFSALLLLRQIPLKPMN